LQRAVQSVARCRDMIGGHRYFLLPCSRCQHKQHRGDLCTARPTVAALGGCSFNSQVHSPRAALPPRCTDYNRPGVTALQHRDLMVAGWLAGWLAGQSLQPRYFVRYLSREDGRNGVDKACRRLRHNNNLLWYGCLSAGLYIFEAAMNAGEVAGCGPRLSRPELQAALAALPECRNDLEYGFVSGTCKRRRVSWGKMALMPEVLETTAIVGEFQRERIERALKYCGTIRYIVRSLMCYYIRAAASPLLPFNCSENYGPITLQSCNASMAVTLFGLVATRSRGAITPRRGLTR
jgi:hypothetical protein